MWYFLDTSVLVKRYKPEVGSDVVHRLFAEHALTSHDALILAAALDLRPFEIIFVCADARSGLLRAAEACGLSTLNPLSPPS